MVPLPSDWPPAPGSVRAGAWAGAEVVVALVAALTVRPGKAFAATAEKTPVRATAPANSQRFARETRWSAASRAATLELRSGDMARIVRASAKATLSET
jgi:hypothetical protein